MYRVYVQGHRVFRSACATQVGTALRPLVFSTLHHRSRLTALRKMATSTDKTDHAGGYVKDTDPVVLKHHRYKNKLGGNLPPAAMIEVQVVGTGAMGSPKCLLINTEFTRYLFNCGEGTQRITMEHKMRISRVENIFLTHRSWSNIGGLLGMCLSLEGTCQVPKVTLHGPPSVESVITMSRGFSQLHKIEVIKSEVSKDCYEDTNFKIDYIPLMPEINEQDTSDVNAPAKKRRRVSEEDMAVAYLLKPRPKQRTLSIEKCVDKGVPVGPHIAKLKNGESITLEDGRTIHPDDVLEPAEANKGILIVECPNKHYINSLLSSEKLQAHGPLDLVVHFTNPKTIRNENYQKWMNSLSNETRHLYANEDGGDLSFQKIYYSQAVLNQIHTDLFPLLYQQKENSKVAAIEDNETHIYGRTNLRFVYRGGVKSKSGSVFQDQCVVIDNDEFIKESMKYEDYSPALLEIKNKMNEVKRSGKNFPEIIFTGTGSSIPNKGRNVSGILMNIDSNKSMLLDCGEDTYGQLLRYYGPEAIKDLLMNMKGVFVSHLHADHHMGLIGFLIARKKVLGKKVAKANPVYLLGPEVMLEWLSTVNENIVFLEDYYKFVSLESLYPAAESSSSKSEVLEEMGLSAFRPVKVNHRQWPHGIVIATKEGYKLVYSGDTSPSANLMSAGKNCDLLIHEATMEDDLAEEAHLKRHSTTSQAIDVGQKMNAKFTLLTHFSQRYAKIPLFNDRFTNDVGIAFDYLRVTPELIPFLPIMLPLLKSVFSEHYAEMEEKQIKRQTKKERESKVKKGEFDKSNNNKSKQNDVENSSNDLKKQNASVSESSTGLPVSKKQLKRQRKLEEKQKKIEGKINAENS